MPDLGNGAYALANTNLGNNTFRRNLRPSAPPGNSSNGTEPHASAGRTSHPLPAGSATSWGAITRGTVLEGVPWPYPVAESHREGRS